MSTSTRFLSTTHELQSRALQYCRELAGWLSDAITIRVEDVPVRVEDVPVASENVRMRVEDDQLRAEDVCKGAV